MVTIVTRIFVVGLVLKKYLVRNFNLKNPTFGKENILAKFQVFQIRFFSNFLQTEHFDFYQFLTNFHFVSKRFDFYQK